MKHLTFIVFMTARLVLSMPFSEISLFEAGQTSCPVEVTR